MARLSNEQKTAGQGTVLPRHIAIIMDGNGRWARKRGLPRSAGHAAGAETFRRVASYCRDLTVYAFSTENWKRSREEVSAIMGLLKKYLEEAVEKMRRENVRIRVLGDTSALSPELRELIARVEAIDATLDTHTQANLCVNYGGRDEIVRAVRAWQADPHHGELTEVELSRFLYTAGMPDPDLIIRPSGEMRISNFLLWQSAYSEFYFTDTLWPDFTEKDMDAAIAAYQMRDRRYGGVKE